MKISDYTESEAAGRKSGIPPRPIKQARDKGENSLKSSLHTVLHKEGPLLILSCSRLGLSTITMMDLNMRDLGQGSASIMAQVARPTVASRCGPVQTSLAKGRLVQGNLKDETQVLGIGGLTKIGFLDRPVTGLETGGAGTTAHFVGKRIIGLLMVANTWLLTVVGR